MPTEAIYLPVSKTVRFAIYPDGQDGPRILAEITERILCERYGASESARNLVERYQSNFMEIQTMALKLYAQSPSTSIVLDKENIARMKNNACDGLIG